VSRLRAIAAVRIGSPDDTLLAGIMAKQFVERGIVVGEEVVRYLVPRIERTYEAAGSCVAWLDQRSLEARRPVSLPFVIETLQRDPPSYFHSAAAPPD